MRRLINVTPIKCADYKTPKELWSGQKPNISHLRVFRCLAWVHILKKRRHKLQPKSRAMIFVGYETGSKGYQFWDAAHQRFEISRDVKFEESQFPAKESNLTQSIPAPLSNCQIPESDNESNSSGLDLVTLAQPHAIPPTPHHTALRPLSPPTPQAPRRTHTPLPAMETAPLQPPVPRYSLCQTKAQEERQSQPGPSTGNINEILIHMFQEVPNFYKEAMSSNDRDKWLKASKEEFKGLIEMGTWKLVN